MGRIRTRLPKGGTLILLWIGGVILLGAVGWGIGWTAHRLLDAREPLPTETPRPTVRPSPVPTATAPAPTGVSPGEPTADQPADTPVLTSTPLATDAFAPAPTLRTYVVQPEDVGLAMIAGKVCPDLVEYADREAFAKEIQRLNPDKIYDINDIRAGMELVIPPCPQ
jgi:Tfp pilus assembly protein FimV